MVWWLKNRFKIEMLIFLLTGMGLLIGVGSPTPGKGVGECLVTISPLPWDCKQCKHAEKRDLYKLYRNSFYN